MLLNIPFYIHVLVYLPFVALARFFERPTVGDSATTPVFSWRVPVIVFAVTLGVAHTAQRLRGEGAIFLFITGYSESLVLYGSLVLLVFCVVVIAIDLRRCIDSTRMQRARSRRGVSNDFDNIAS